MTFGGDPNGAPLADDLEVLPGQLVSAEPELRLVELDPSLDRFVVLACDGIWDVLQAEGAGEGQGEWEDAKHGKICSQFIWIYDILWPVEGKGMNMMCFHAGIAMACDGLRFVHLSHCVIVTMHSATAHQLKWCRGSKHRKKKRKERKNERKKT